MAPLPLLLVAVWAGADTPARGAAADDSFEKSVQPFLNKNCYRCHNSKTPSGGLDLGSYKSRESVAQDRERWEKIQQKLRAGEMPPAGAPRPDATQSQAVLGWIESEFERADRLTKPDPGRVTARRLNRVEYDNTIRDLLGVDFRPADDFPQDDSGYGFDNIGDVLSLSPILMEKYLVAAEKIARTALSGPEPWKPTVVRYQPVRRRSFAEESAFLQSQGYTLTKYDVTGLSMPNAFHARHRFPVDGEYVFRITPEGRRPPGSEAIQFALWIDGKQATTLEVERTATLEGQMREHRTSVTAGEHWIAISFLRMYEGLPPHYGGLNPSQKTPPPQDPGAEQIVAPGGIRFNNIDVAGPFNQEKGPSHESLKKIYACGHPGGHHQPECDRNIVADLARRAYRRPIKAEEIERLLSLISRARTRGDSFEEAIGLALRAILISPHFLFRIETDPKGGTAEARAISETELASRLSYFLWSSMPDEELMGYADRQVLRRPDVLAAQVRRMLADPKSRALVENFGGQWLQTRSLESIKPDPDRFPNFDEYLRMSMRKETELFFERIIREDRSILDFIDGDYTFLNERLAHFYGIPGVSGPQFRRVDLAGTQRGGVLTQASVLAVSSYANRTSPVLRGKWILENLLNAPPPPPPPDVPNLDEGAALVPASLRQQMEKHRANATCASCHVRMDPLGFGLENFDAIGAWRAQDQNTAIDASGTLPDGRSFRGPAELKAILKSDRDSFAECLTEKMLTYALGRGLERYDRPAVKTIVRRVARDHYRISSLVLGMVNSLPFQMRRRDGGE